MTTTTPAPAPGSPEPPADLAARFGLAPSAFRPSMRTYLKQIWERRNFILTFARSRALTQFAGARLGQLWQLLTPLLNAGVYFLIFGLLLKTSRGIENFIGYLVIGVFVFTFFQKTVSSSARSITGNLALIRALHFPRACMPVSAMLVELYQLLISMVLLCGIILISGAPLTWRWLTLIPLLLLMVLFGTGVSLIMARIGASMPDVNQLLPFATRIWLYASGVIFSIPQRTADMGNDLLGQIMMANPAAVYIELARDAMLERPIYDPALGQQYEVFGTGTLWALAAGWAVVILILGFWYFWRAEEKYGRG